MPFLLYVEPDRCMTIKWSATDYEWVVKFRGCTGTKGFICDYTTEDDFGYCQHLDTDFSTTEMNETSRTETSVVSCEASCGDQCWFYVYKAREQACSLYNSTRMPATHHSKSWFVTAPDSELYEKKCFSFYIHPVSGEIEDNQPCSHYRPPFELQEEALVNDSGLLMEPATYRQYDVWTSSESYIAHRNQCGAVDSRHLLDLRNSAASSALHQLIPYYNQRLLNTVDKFAIALTRASNGTFFWYDGQADAGEVEISYTLPYEENPSKNCTGVVFNTTSLLHTVKAVSCENHIKAICETDTGDPCRFVEHYGGDLLPTGMNINHLVNVSQEVCEQRCGGESDPKCWIYKYENKLAKCELYSRGNMPNCEEISSWSEDGNSRGFVYRRVCLEVNVYDETGTPVTTNCSNTVATNASPLATAREDVLVTKTPLSLTSTTNERTNAAESMNKITPVEGTTDQSTTVTGTKLESTTGTGITKSGRAVGSMTERNPDSWETPGKASSIGNKTRSDVNINCLFVCPCRKIVTKETVMSDILESLTLDKKMLSAYKRKYQSTSDDRLSTTCLGYLGVSVLASVIILLIVMDSDRLIPNVKYIAQKMKRFVSGKGK